ncbi:class I SAM-dependent methyltransferase [Kribbella sandramycini]|uniref:SAM-dependent methyltransferase n=1 Tax=Kribbella sandramycini TaxID=60450 RepID=A0A7Y4L5Q4_9ACTN|nr:class I SAM-dependent methyltransferase [Kribbella sandramycini]MBB6570816.1 SAM-dependent methyltransferase [Kribbella sandramycini]NOL43947.1 class I SAM-dependent methyltransferase [Kribbella sandramycini]
MNLMCPARILLLPGDVVEVSERVAHVYAATFDAAAGARLAERLGVRLTLLPDLTGDPEHELQAISDQHRGETVVVLGLDLGLRLPALVEHTGDGWTRVPTSNERTLATYEQAAEQFRELIPAEPNHQLIGLLELKPGARVLELGSGTGRDAVELERRGFAVRRTDATEAFLEMIRADGYQADRLNALNDDFGGPYDAVFADAVFLHFDRALLPGVLRKAAHAAPVLAFSTMEGQGEEWSNRLMDLPRHFVQWTEEALRDVLTATGWSVERLERGAGNFSSWMQVLAVRA